MCTRGLARLLQRYQRCTNVTGYRCFCRRRTSSRQSTSIASPLTLRMQQPQEEEPQATDTQKRCRRGSVSCHALRDRYISTGEYLSIELEVLAPRARAPLHGQLLCQVHVAIAIDVPLSRQLHMPPPCSYQL